MIYRHTNFGDYSTDTSEIAIKTSYCGRIAMPALFPVPYTPNTGAILFHSPNALSSLFFLVPIVAPGQHVIFYILLVSLAASSFAWWGFQLKNAQLIDLSCITALSLYFPLRVLKAPRLGLITTSVFAMTLYMSYIGQTSIVQGAIAMSLLLAIVACVYRRRFVSAITIIVAIVFKILDMHGIVPYGTALFHVLSAVALGCMVLKAPPY